MPETSATGERVHRECERLFMAAAPFVQAEQEAEEALAKARAALKTYRNAASLARAAWVDFLLTHDHQALCDPARRATSTEGT